MAFFPMFPPVITPSGVYYPERPLRLAPVCRFCGIEPAQVSHICPPLLTKSNADPAAGDE